MSTVIGSQIKKFTKWLIVRKEIKYKQELDLLNKEKDDYNVCLVQLSKVNSDWLDRIHARHQMINIGILIISSLGAISGLIVTVFGLL